MNNQENSNILSVPDYERFICTSNKPVIVIIVASWCGNCQIMAPLLERLADQYKEQINFVMAKNNTNNESINDHNSEMLPRLLFYKNKKLIDHVNGTVSQNILDHKIIALLENSNNTDNVN